MSFLTLLSFFSFLLQEHKIKIGVVVSDESNAAYETHILADDGLQAWRLEAREMMTTAGLTSLFFSHPRICRFM